MLVLTGSLPTMHLRSLSVSTVPNGDTRGGGMDGWIKPQAAEIAEEELN